jgi:hypothetical protein
MRVEIDVTQSDIVRGQPHDGEADPISLAVCRALGLDPESGLVYTSTHDIYLDDDAPNGFRAGIYDLPPEAAGFADKNLDGLDVAPFRFTLDDEEGG